MFPASSANFSSVPRIKPWFELQLVLSADTWNLDRSDILLPCPAGSVVSMSDSWPGGCEFNPRLRRTFFPAYFRLPPLQMHVRKIVRGFGKKSCVSIGVRKPGNICASPTAMIWPYLLKVALNPNTPIKQLKFCCVAVSEPIDCWAICKVLSRKPSQQHTGLENRCH